MSSDLYGRLPAATIEFSTQPIEMSPVNYLVVRDVLSIVPFFRPAKTCDDSGEVRCHIHKQLSRRRFG